MKKLILAIGLVALTAPLFNTASQAAVGVNRGDCYNILISWCNDNSNHPSACANAKMDACDKMHKAMVAEPVPLPLTAKPDEPRPTHDPVRRPKPQPAPGLNSAAGSALRG